MLRSYLERRAERRERRALESLARQVERAESARRWAELAAPGAPVVEQARAVERQAAERLAERLLAGAQARRWSAGRLAERLCGAGRAH